MEDTAVPTVDLEKILTDEMLANRQSWDKDGKIYATDLGVALGPEHSGCPRAFWEKCHNAPRREPSAGEMLMWRMGELVEEEIIRLLKTALPKVGWELVGTQERVRQYGVSGRLDVRIRHVETGAIRIVDVKTKRGQAFGFLNEAKPDNVLQVQYYMDGTDAVGGDLLYVDREGQNFVRQFEVERNDARPRKAAEILESIRDNETPPAPCKAMLSRTVNKGPDSLYLKNPWQVEWCDLKKCPCRAAIGKVPSGIAGKVSKKGGVKMSEGCEEFADTVLTTLRANYPDEDFFLESE